MYLCNASLGAMRYIAAAPAKRLFSFTLPEEALTRLNLATENYLAAQSGRCFSTLEYWKKTLSQSNALKVKI